jgi:hypothetical protein
MRKILFVLVVGLILTSMSFGSEGKLNVWVRGPNCEVVDRPGHLHVYNCQGIQVLMTWFEHGHAEVVVPPGCYIIRAGVVWGNIYTDKTMVIVKCGEESCVNLVLPRFLHPITPPAPAADVQFVKMYYCPAAILPALVVNAGTAKIKPGELDVTIDVMARAARIDKERLLDVVRDEIKLVEEYMPKVKQTEEQKEMREYLYLLKKALSSQTQKK